MFIIKLIGIIATLSITESLPSTTAARKKDFIHVLARNSKAIIANSKLTFDRDTPFDHALKHANDFIKHRCLPFIQSLTSSPFQNELSTFYHMNPPRAVAKLGFGFLAGYSSGFFLKRITNTVIFFFGGTIMSLQALSYFGYISVDYNKIKRDMSTLFDLNADGLADDKDIHLVYDKVRLTFL